MKTGGLGSAIRNPYENKPRRKIYMGVQEIKRTNGFEERSEK